MSDAGPPIDDYTADIVAHSYYLYQKASWNANISIFANVTVVFRATSSC